MSTLPRLLRSSPPLPLVLTGLLTAMTGLRLLFLHQPVGRDEGGFLLVGGGWTRGSSLYGDYFVDRPPLLVWIMEAAGDVTTLRLIGLVSCAAMVLGVARTVHLVRGRRAAAWAAAAAALFSTAGWLGVARTNGEMLTVGFTAWAIALATQAVVAPGRRPPWLLALGAGVLAGCAVLVKQTVADALVFAFVLALAVAWQQPTQRRRASVVMASGAIGLAAASLVGLVGAAARGTTVGELFDALITFRAEAGEVIRASATSATTDRLGVLLATWVVSGLALIAALTVWHGLRRREPMVLAALATIAVVSATSLLGGSYWAHYLFQLVPASAVAVGLLVDLVRPRVRWGLAGLVVAATLANLVFTVVHPPHDGVEAETVGQWLRQSGEVGDTAVIAYGQPNVLFDAGMSSPYPYLWSLPARTLDPDLVTLSGVLAGSTRPTWFVDWSGIDSWGISDPARLQVELDRRYREVSTVCGRVIWLERGVQRTLAPVGECP